MTVVAYKDGVMASDTACFSGDMRYLCAHPKVIRCDLGLVGTSGRSSDAVLCQRWFMAGCPKQHPEFCDDKGDELHCLWVKLDGVVMWSGPRLLFHPIHPPYTIGEATATAFVEGAMLAGMSAVEAVELAIRHCVWVGGEVHWERLG